MFNNGDKIVKLKYNNVLIYNELVTILNQD